MPDESMHLNFPFFPKNFLGGFVRSLAFQMHSGSLNALTFEGSTLWFPHFYTEVLFYAENYVIQPEGRVKSHSRGLLAQHPTLETDLEHHKNKKNV